MTRVIFYTATTLNGFLADEHDSLDWLFAVPGGETAESGDPDFPDFLAGIGALVMGSSTYEWMLAHENLLDDPSKWQSFYGTRATFVFTTRELPVVPGADISFVFGAIDDAWPRIEAAAGDRDVWMVGGGDLAGQFADAGLLDELRLSVAPATLVAGKPLFPRALGAHRLHLDTVRQKGQFAELAYSLGAASGG